MPVHPSYTSSPPTLRPELYMTSFRSAPALVPLLALAAASLQLAPSAAPAEVPVPDRLPFEVRPDRTEGFAAVYERDFLPILPRPRRSPIRSPAGSARRRLLRPPLRVPLVRGLRGGPQQTRWAGGVATDGRTPRRFEQGLPGSGPPSFPGQCRRSPGRPGPPPIPRSEGPRRRRSPGPGR